MTTFQEVFGTELSDAVTISIKRRIGGIIQRCIKGEIRIHEGIENFYLKNALFQVRLRLEKEGRTQEQAKSDVDLDKLRAYLVLKLEEKPHIREQVEAEILDHYGVRLPASADD